MILWASQIAFAHSNTLPLNMEIRKATFDCLVVNFCGCISMKTDLEQKATTSSCVTHIGSRDGHETYRGGCWSRHESGLVGIDQFLQYVSRHERPGLHDMRAVQVQSSVTTQARRHRGKLSTKGIY